MGVTSNWCHPRDITLEGLPPPSPGIWLDISHLCLVDCNSSNYLPLVYHGPGPRMAILWLAPAKQLDMSRNSRPIHMGMETGWPNSASGQPWDMSGWHGDNFGHPWASKSRDIENFMGAEGEYHRHPHLELRNGAYDCVWHQTLFFRQSIVYTVMMQLDPAVQILISYAHCHFLGNGEFCTTMVYSWPTESCLFVL